MTDILLINPPAIIFPKKKTVNMCLGILYIGTYLEKHGFSVKIVNCKSEENYMAKIKEEAERTSLFAGLTVMSAEIANAMQICEIIRETNVKLPIVWGGAHPTLYPLHTCEDSLVDVSVFGEGEETAKELANALETNRPFSDIKGLAYKDKNGGVCINAPRERPDINNLPMPNYNLLNKFTLDKISHDTIQVHTGRGCDYNCTFCIHAATKNKWHGKTAENMVQEFGSTYERFKFKFAYIQDDDFFYDVHRVVRFSELYRKHKFDFNWSAPMRASYISERKITGAVLKDFYNAGCRRLGFGAESGSPRILRLLKKGITVENILNANRMCKIAGIKPAFSFMTAIPGETKKEALMTINLIKQLARDNPEAQFQGPQFYRPYPPGELYKLAIEYGWKEPKNLQEWCRQQSTSLGGVSSRNFPWVKDYLYAENIWYMNHIAVKKWKVLWEKKHQRYPKFVVLAYAVIVKLRYRFNFFNFLWEQKLIDIITRILEKYGKHS